MWVSFPISRRVRVVLPWFVAIPLIPIAAALWMLGLTFDMIRWVWSRPRKPHRPSGSDAVVRVTVKHS